jgi:pyruvate kinase
VRRTKILATVGPASSDPAVLRDLISAGTNAFRLNLSHGSESDHRSILRTLHRLADHHPDPIGIVADLQGPKIRLGPLALPSYVVRAGDEWTFRPGNGPGDRGNASVSVRDFADAGRSGDPILLGDGAVELVVVRASRDRLVGRIVHGGMVAEHSGFYLPRATLRTSILGPKDRRDLTLALEEGVDFVALSFVRGATDISAARRAIRRIRPHSEVGIIAKIERPEALRNIDSILTEVDGIMVARGDLGIEVPLERLPLEQKRLLKASASAGKFAIVATQMLMSMVLSPRPTRAECTDVANAVLDGADAVMLSEETAVGQYPIEAVRWLDRIARATEHGISSGEVVASSPPNGPTTGAGAVAAAAAGLAQRISAVAIVTPTHSGDTARQVARHRPQMPVVALSALPSTRRQLTLISGVVARPLAPHRSLAQLRRCARDAVRSLELTEPRGPVVLTAGFPVEGRPTNLVTVLEPAPRPRRARPTA